MENEAGRQRGLVINIHAMGMPFNGETVATESLGGSESAAHYLAQELAKRGHKVSVWTTKESESTETNGVKYHWMGAPSERAPFGERFEHYARNTPHDVLIIQRHPAAFHRQYAAKVCIWQLHDLALYRYAGQMMAGLWQVDAVTTVSEWHAEQVKKVFNINPDVLRVVPNGVDPDLYAGESGVPVFTTVSGQTFQLPTNATVLLYQSRPERGLEPLLREDGIMDRLAKQAFPAVLVIAGYDNTVEAMRGLYQQLHERAQKLPNVMWVGALTKPELARLQRHADLMVYPCGAFEEVSCISAMEAMHAGLPLIATHRGALPETCAGSGSVLLDNLPDNKVDIDAFVERITSLKRRSPDVLTLREKQRKAAKTRTWWRAANDLELVILEAFARRHSKHANVMRHAIEHSDIDFADWFIRTHTPYSDPITTKAVQELDARYAFTRTPEKYAEKYRRDAAEYYDAHEHHVLGEDVTGSTRFRGVMNFVAQQQAAAGRPIRVLDYGCAHGHYAIPIAKALREIGSTVYGVDISERAVAAAIKWAEKEGIYGGDRSNVEFQTLKDFEDDIETGATMEFDVIIAAEVLEHVPNDRALLDQLTGLLAPNGVLIITTPNGRWEWNETVKFRTWRQHLRHYEKRDIEELCGSHPAQILHAPASHDKSGLPLGSWVWAVRPSSETSWGEIDYPRKLEQLAPRQTISACMIVKDGERTLRKCIESFIDYVDEICITIDARSTDRTEEILGQIEQDFPHRAITWRRSEKTALVDGFDAMRNESIEAASGDWILWCDADEELQTPENMHKLCRPSMHNGFGFAQVHYSCDPEQVLTTDFPCRLFRNHQGVRFYGLVHEHPEHEIGKAVTWSLVRPEMKFLHAGYVNEDTRRARYERNLPLVHKDREHYPNRELNKFLLIRDIAQGLMFEQMQVGGQVLPGHSERAQQAIDLMEDLVDTSPHVRMISDAMQYYSHCVQTQGRGFDAEIAIKTAMPHAPDMAASFSIRGRFHDRPMYTRVLRKFSEESTKQYEDRYL